jgi:hypothetical protein
MYYQSGNQVHGVLKDYDLFALDIPGRILGTDRTGTWPYMAIELVEATKPIKHIYG